MAEPSPAGHARAASSGWRRIGQVVSIAAVIWVIWQWREQWPLVGQILVASEPSTFALGLLLAGLGAYLTVVPFFQLVKRCVVADATYLEVAHLYFVSQLLKHLPGRVWGIGYQLARGRSRGGAQGWVGVNLAHMGLATCFALGISTLVLIASHSLVFAGMFLVALAAIYLAGPSLAKRVGQHLGGRSKFPRIAQVLGAYLGLPVRDWHLIAVAFVLSGLLQYLAWIAFGSATGLLVASKASQLFALYVLAWFVGWVSLFTPSGLGVRELVFLSLATAFEPQAVAAMAVIGRGSMLIVDVVAGALHIRDTASLISR